VDNFLLQLLCDPSFFGVSVSLRVLIYGCCEGSSDGVPQLGDLLSLGDVTLNGIRDSRFGSAPTGVLAAQRGCLVMHLPLKPS
jgi:hypothetical protein